MQVQLARRVEVRCVHVIATLAFPSHRPIESALIRWIEAQSAAGADISAAQVCADGSGLLPGRPLVLGQRLLNVAEQLQLVEVVRGRLRGLSEIGRKALEDAKVYVPERSTWSLYFAEDPLLAHPLIHFATHNEPTAHQEIPRGAANRSAAAARQFAKLPDILARLRGRTLELPSIERPLVRVDEIELQCEQALSSVLHAEVLVPEKGGSTSRIHGTVEDARIDVGRDWPGLRFWEVFSSLLDQHGLAPLWNRQAGALRRRFAELVASERTLRSFRQDLPFQRPVLDALGAFAATTVAEVPVVAASDDDAQMWLDWLLLDGIRRYCFPEHYRAQGEQTLKLFSSFEVQVPEQKELAGRIRAQVEAPGRAPPRPDSRYWHLQAPLDLTMEVRS
jgi:hypothetical protein